MAIHEWWEGGERVEAGGRSLFVRRSGSGPWLTLLHGFPSSSHDWAGSEPALAERFSVLAFDWVGYGASEKPHRERVTMHQQVDALEALWGELGVNSTAIVAHDIGATAAQEVLARNLEGELEVELRSVVLTNGGVYPDLHRPEPVQTALLDEEQGPQIGPNLNQELIAGSLRPTLFAEGVDVEAIARDMWAGLARDEGHHDLHLLIRYVLDRREHAGRWTEALERTAVPLSYVWGMKDPVSGAHMAERIRERRPDAPFEAMDDVGHWPPLEAPDRVAHWVLAHA